jgi:uncharacterized protein (UPF0548 family)
VFDERLLRHPNAYRYLDDLHYRKPNFNLEDRSEFTAESGWQIDDYCQQLPPEPPGELLSDGSWEIGRRLIRHYEFADPDIVRIVYHADEFLVGRDILLIGRFHGLRFYLGCRVGDVFDETRIVQGKPVRIWGWNYHTLTGHLEMGEMTYEIWKRLDTGAVEFRIHAFSRVAEIKNPIIRLGFWIFGRRMQLKFARNACRRMYELTKVELDRKAARAPVDEVPRAAKSLIIGPMQLNAEPHKAADCDRNKEQAVDAGDGTETGR